ncbi:hypothetical protein CJJ07_005095 [Candidozyma auris]|nr:hypothetical protein CJJ07_005095 [[Candida] auris]QEL63346.1 hypothetical protein CJJ09_005547 [[Candida] auris]
MSDQMSMAVASLQPEQWTASSNEALSIFVTDTQGKAHNFSPLFTYPIFGEAETIFGFKGLRIFLCFDSVTFLPFLNVKFDNKLEDIEVDPKSKLLELLPSSTVYKDEAKWRDSIEEEQKNYQIPGTKVCEDFTKNGEHYAIYKLDLTSERGIELHKRLQILVLLFIEAGTYIDFKDPLWDLYVMYRTTDASLPEVVGFATAYNYWVYPGSAEFDSGVEKIRKKISQFIVLPHLQGQSLGAELYERLYKLWLQDDRIVEIVVEDPNESFDDLRDRVDFTRLVEEKKVDLSTLKVDDVTPQWIETFKRREKLEKRQLSRLLEMFFLHQLKYGPAKPSKKAVRLFIKRKLFEKNREALSGLDEPTKLDKLQTAYESLASDYYRILEPLEKRAKRSIDNGTSGGDAEGFESTAKKQKKE